MSDTITYQTMNHETVSATNFEVINGWYLVIHTLGFYSRGYSAVNPLSRSEKYSGLYRDRVEKFCRTNNVADYR